MTSVRALRRGATASFMAATLSVVALSGCSSNEPGTAGDEISLSYPVAENSPYEAMAKKYMESHDGVTVTLKPIPSDNYDTLLRTQMQGGNASDVVMVTAGSGAAVSLITLAKAGLLAPLNETSGDLIDSASHSQFFVDDKPYGQPTDFGVTGTIFNDATGVAFPAGIDDLMDTCRELTTKGVSLFAVAGKVPINAGLMAVSLAATQVYADDPEWDVKRAQGEVTFADTPGWRAALDSILSMQAAGCFQPGAEGAGFEAITGGIGQGVSLGAFLPGGVIAQLGPAIPDAQLVVEPVPTPEAGTPFIFASSDYALAITASSDRKDAAQAYLDWLAEPEQAQAYAELAGSLPITGAGDLDLSGTAYAGVADLLDAGRYTTLPVNIWKPAVFDVLGSDVQGLLTGQKNVDAVLKDLDAAWNS